MEAGLPTLDRLRRKNIFRTAQGGACRTNPRASQARSVVRATPAALRNLEKASQCPGRSTPRSLGIGESCYPNFAHRCILSRSPSLRRPHIAPTKRKRFVAAKTLRVFASCPHTWSDVMRPCNDGIWYPTGLSLGRERNNRYFESIGIGGLVDSSSLRLQAREPGLEPERRSRSVQPEGL
jgi:hypothetical protein